MTNYFETFCHACGNLLLGHLFCHSSATWHRGHWQVCGSKPGRSKTPDRANTDFFLFPYPVKCLEETSHTTLHLLCWRKKHHALLIISLPKYPIVLDLPWPQLHNPLVSCSESKILRWYYCHQSCLKLPNPPNASTFIESPETVLTI